MAEYIEREALLDDIENTLVFSGRTGHANPKQMGARMVVQRIKAAPAADVAPVVHGRWEAQKYWKYENKHSIQYRTNRCSLCHCDVSSRLLYNYCPNCGAHMKDGE